MARPDYADMPRRRKNGGGCMMALIVAGFAIFSYLGSSQTNPVTGESQRVAMTTDQEIAMGLQAAPEMARQFGGTVSGPEAAMVSSMGEFIVRNSTAKSAPYDFEFHLLADRKTVNAFALPGGQIFITRALLERLQTQGQLAGVLGHEIGHVIERHSAEHMAKQQLTQGLTTAAVLASESATAGMVAQAVGQMVNMKYGREDELESDEWGVRLMVESGFDPNSLIGVMKILEEASGGGNRPEFMSTHPNPGNRIERIRETIATAYPDGLPEGLKP